MSVSTRGSFQATVTGEHRDGQGNLIARTVSIQSPPPPSCTRPSCLWKFFWETLLCSLISTYHSKRVRYAEKNRHKKIPTRYRTGDDSPKNIRQVILAIIILKLRR